MVAHVSFDLDWRGKFILRSKVAVSGRRLQGLAKAIAVVSMALLRAKSSRVVRSVQATAETPFRR
jgi:hypothetical protein